MPPSFSLSSLFFFFFFFSGGGMLVDGAAVSPGSGAVDR